MEGVLAVPMQEHRSISDRMTPQQIKADANLILQVMESSMTKGMDYGTIQGCGDKPTLFKPGSEKLMMVFRLASKPVIEDLSGPDEIRYRIATEIIHTPTGTVVGYGVGEASSNEEKYRWRKAVCDEEFYDTAEDRRRAKWAKEWKSGKAYTTKQVRTNPADLANTILKMADKRSVISGVLKATAASAIFTQDLEDLSDDIREAVATANEGTTPLPTMPQEKAAPAPAAAPAAAKSADTKSIPYQRPFEKMAAKFPSKCKGCGESIKEKDPILYDRANSAAFHETCL